MQKHMKDLKPTVFDDLIAMNALYRPGPMEYIPSFIRRKHGEEEITYDLPSDGRIPEGNLWYYGLPRASDVVVAEAS